MILCREVKRSHQSDDDSSAWQRDSSYDNHRQQFRTIDSRIKIYLHVMVYRKLVPLIFTEVNRGGRTMIQEGDSSEHDRFARYISDETKLHGAHCATYCLASTRIRDEPYKVRPASLKQTTRKQPQSKCEFRRRTHRPDSRVCGWPEKVLVSAPDKRFYVPPLPAPDELVKMLVHKPEP